MKKANPVNNINASELTPATMPTERLQQPVYLFLLFLIIFSACSKGEYGTERDQDFNLNWRYMIGDPPGASATEFDDKSWTGVDLPHDWSITDYPFQDSLHSGPFFRNLPGGKDVGYLRDGTAWYRKSFALSRDTKDDRVIISFDGIQTRSEVWVNGEKAGENVNGYSPFWLDITNSLSTPGKSNIIAVKTVNPGENSRWFAGAGIYRNVKLSVVNAVSVLPHGIGITTPEVSETFAKIVVELQVGNHTNRAAEVTCSGLVKGPDGTRVPVEPVVSQVPASANGMVYLSATIPSPQPWSPEHPHLYQAEIQIEANGRQVDRVTQTFGIRTIAYSASSGFLLNGKVLLMKGSCMHHDNGLLGSAAFGDAEYRRVRIMKENGFNAIRTSHNPPSEAFLNACDELGMLVIDEAFDHWVQPKRVNDYSNYFEQWHKKDIQAMVLRDRNHPSIVMWSFGNEVQERANPEGVEIGKDLVAAIHEIDTTRPVTQAVCGFWDNPGKTWDASAPAFEITDIAGYNYQWEQYERDHEKHPERIMYGSESVPQHAWENWQKVVQHPYVIGDFVWTGMDYIGESGIGHTYLTNDDIQRPNFLQPWPWYVSWCGDIDITGNKKPQSFYRDVLWGESNLELFVRKPVPEGFSEQISFWGWPRESKSWTWPGHENTEMTVTVYTSFPAVRLELNGRTIAEKHIGFDDKLTATFVVPYAPGTLKATGLEEGETRESVSLETTGEARNISLLPESTKITATRSSLVFVNVVASDAEGLPVNNASTALTVEVDGPAVLMAAGNGSPQHDGSFTDPTFSLYNGQGLIILRSTGTHGNIVVKVTADGLNPVYANILAE